MGTVITVAAIALGVLVGAGLQRRPRLSIGDPSPATTPTAPDPAPKTEDAAPGR